jgi:antitoxin ParD1/3/4
MARNTSVVLGDHFENFITKKLETGRYHSTSEIIRSALRLLEMEENKLTILRNAIEEGENSGIFENFDPKQHLMDIHEKYKVS